MNDRRDLDALEIKHVSFSYGQQNVLEDIHLKIPQGSFLGLVGPNGSGKSTLIKCILGLLTPGKGEINIFGTPINKFRHWEEVGFVSQKANSFNSGFPATVFEVVSMGLYGKVGLFRFLTKKHKEKVKEAIYQVGMEKYMYQNIGQLSGGQQQRVFIARALVSDPKLLILDEPTVGVDAKSVQNFYTMLKRLNVENKMTLILVTHDIGVMTEYITDVACLNKFLHFHGGTSEFEERQEDIVSNMYGHDVQVITHNHHHHHHDDRGDML
ncbi:metal ABC transporter ATP-binding protein [Evansella cellulosilytica]|uniref:ABC transporter related protein n=1 Tax=Evansella cellulosilytica (strain ATCC 21833 / DSM 2522 / FERM P-1141 / JCM 9156 / N-4) TaxID=649639 RepID=E6TWU5_EVAC2|nr:ABC transporter ATP-binding protein [Evansella cellulosilytica]ADU29895.1 ABC transporter related protein [Evansella cellulosilytica DSM 2522]